MQGNVDVICGGPPCQGISGFNRFRNTDQPLQDEKNKQLAVFMDIVAFLKPRFVLMENVVDLIKFSKGYLGRYAFARLLAMNYQARLGMMAAGAYGLPQFRMRVFMWGAVPKEVILSFSFSYLFIQVSRRLFSLISSTYSSINAEVASVPIAYP